MVTKSKLMNRFVTKTKVLKYKFSKKHQQFENEIFGEALRDGFTNDVYNEITDRFTETGSKPDQTSSKLILVKNLSRSYKPFE